MFFYSLKLRLFERIKYINGLKIETIDFKCKKGFIYNKESKTCYIKLQNCEN